MELPDEYKGTIDYQIYKLYQLTGKPAVRVPEMPQGTARISKGEMIVEASTENFDTFIFPKPMDSAFYPHLRDLDSCNITEALEKYFIVLGEIFSLEHEFDANMEPEKKFSQEEIKIGKQLGSDLELYLAQGFLESLKRCSCSCIEKPDIPRPIWELV